MKIRTHVIGFLRARLNARPAICEPNETTSIGAEMDVWETGAGCAGSGFVWAGLGLANAGASRTGRVSGPSGGGRGGSPSVGGSV